VALRTYSNFAARYTSSARYTLDEAPYRILQQQGSQTIVDVELVGLPRAWQIQFTSADTFITNLFR
jgi:hypothetical protein